MSAGLAVCSGVRPANRRLTRCLGVSPTLGSATRGRRILDRGGSRLRRRRSPHPPTLGDRFPPTRCRRPGGAPGPGTAAEIDPHPGEDRRSLAGRQPDGARLRHRVVVRPAPGAVDRAGVRHPLPPRLPDRLAAAARLHPSEAPARPPRARRRGHRAVAGEGLAAHKKRRGDGVPTSS